MRYWGFVARGLQSKVLHLVINNLSKWLLFAFKHPLKTVWYIFRLYLVLLLAGLCLTFVTSKAIAQQSIYERASGGVPAKTSNSCTTGQTPGEWLSGLNTNRPVTTGDTTYERYSITKNETVFYPPSTVCEIVLEAQSYYYRDNGDRVYDEGYQFSSKNIRGSVELVPSCENLGNNADGSFAYPDNKHMYTMQDGTTQCFTAQALEDVDTCDSSTPDLLGTADSPAFTCYTKDDGSKCAMSKYEVNGQYAYAQNLEPSACYEGEIAVNPYEDPTTTDLTGSECQPLGNGIRACPSDPSEVCNQSTGVCNTGCGTYDIGDGPVFVCLQDEFASCDPTTTASCSTPQTPETPIDEPYLPPVTIDDPEFTTTTGTNTLLSSTNQILTGVNQGIQGVSAGMQGVEKGLKDIKEELETSATVAYPDDLYTANDYEQRNYGTVLENAVNEMRNTELVQSVNEFFEIELTGTCPVYSTTVPYINTTITIDQFCGSVMTSIWPIVSAIIILVFSVLAFKVAVL